MKLFDKVKLVSDKKQYEIDGVKKGDVGTIIQECLMFTRNKIGCFDVVFYPEAPNKDVYVSIDVCDLELLEESSITDDELLECISDHDTSKWCKVVDGHIMNLKGEKLNKIPYQYDSWGDGYDD